MNSKPRVMVALSGGIDSAVAAATLIDDGFDCVAVYVRMIPPNLESSENVKGNLTDAQRISEKLGIELQVVDYSWEMGQIVNHFLYEYSQGKSPNPCARCNARLKFGKLLAFVRQQGADFLATGHYARIIEHEGLPRLARALCLEQDQSYVLFGIRRSELPNVLFPNGRVKSKDVIRQQARQRDLPAHDQGDGREVCFVPRDDYEKFFARHRAGTSFPGPIVDLHGRVLGEHSGIDHYAVGQRRGLRIAAAEPMYVVRIDLVSNAIVVGPRTALAKTSLTAVDLNWLVPTPSRSFRAKAQIRASHQPAEALVEPLDLDRVAVTFDEPQYAITPGQAVVFYENDCVVGGGWIESDGP